MNLDVIIRNLIEKQKLPSRAEIKDLIKKAKESFQNMPNIVNLSVPLNVVGDIHGQFYDLLELFNIGGQVPESNYLFMGDFVDRGYYSLETLILLVALHVRYSSRVMLLRGNHESRQITQVYGFYDECLKLYGDTEIWEECCSFFDYLPLCALIGERIFCVHGGLSKDMQLIDDVRKMDRVQEVPHEGLMCDLLWSDPDEQATSWAMSPRGAGYLFGTEVVSQFLSLNRIEYICRAHQLVQEGYKTMFNNTLATVWSAPNYCYRCGNVASVLCFDENSNKEFRTFDPYPEHMRSREGENISSRVPEYFL